IRIEESEHVSVIDYAHIFLFLQLGNLPLKLLHLRPMHFRPEMMLRVVTVIEENPIIELPVTAHSPGDRLIWVSAIVAEVSVQVTEAMAEIEEGKEEKHVAPINKGDWFRRDNKCHRNQHRNKCRQLDGAPAHIGISALGQFAFNSCRIIAEKAEEDITPRVFCFSIMTMFVDGNPIDSFAVLIGAIGVSIVMLEMQRVVIGL